LNEAGGRNAICHSSAKTYQPPAANHTLAYLGLQALDAAIGPLTSCGRGQRASRISHDFGGDLGRWTDRESGRPPPVRLSLLDCFGLRCSNPD